MLLIASVVIAVWAMFTSAEEETNERGILYKSNGGNIRVVHCSDQFSVMLMFIICLYILVACTPNRTTLLGPFPSVNCTTSPYIWCKLDVLPLGYHCNAPVL